MLVRVPQGDRASQEVPHAADLRRVERDRTVYEVPSGTCSFTVRGVRAAAWRGALRVQDETV